MAAVSNDTVIGRLRAKREALAREQTIDMPIPGYGGELVCRYRLLDPLTEGKEIGQRLQTQFPKKEQETELLHFVNVDTIVAACVGFFIKHPGSGDLHPLGDSADGMAGLAPTYEDTQLAELLGFEAETARQAVVAVFGGNRAAVNVHAMRLQSWMSDTSGELTQGI